MSKIIDWKKAKLLLGAIVIIVLLRIGTEVIDPLQATKETTTGVVTRSVQKFPRYQNSYREIVVELKDKTKLNFSMPTNLSWKTGDIVHLRIHKRRFTGLKKYLPESEHSINKKENIKPNLIDPITTPFKP